MDENEIFLNLNDFDNNGQNEYTKLILITYETSNKLKIFLKNGSGKFNRKEVKNKKRKHEKNFKSKFEFNVFEIPNYLKNLLVENVRSNAKVYYLYFNTTTKTSQEYRIIQKYSPHLMSDCFYETDVVKYKDEPIEFLLNLEFNSHEDYKLMKNPSGNKVQKQLDKLILVLLFIFFHKKDNQLEQLANFRKQYRNFDFLEEANGNYFFCKFLKDIFDNRITISVSTLNYGKNLVSLISCCFGFISQEKLNILKNECLMNRIEIDFIVETFLKSKEFLNDDFKVISSNEFLSKDFLNGICYFVFSCLNNIDLFEKIIRLLEQLQLQKVFSVEDISKMMVNLKYSLNPKYFNEQNRDKLRKEFLNIKDESIKHDIIMFFMKVCPSFNTLLVYYFIIFDHKNILNEIVLKNQNLIRTKLLHENKSLPSNIEKEMEIFQKFQDFFSDLKKDVYTYLLKTCSNANEFKIVIQNSKSALEKSDFFEAKEVFKAALKHLELNIFPLKTFLECISNVKKVDDDETRKVISEFCNRTVKSLKSLSNLTIEDIKNLTKLLNSKLLYPVIPWSYLFDESFLSKFRNSSLARYALENILLPNISDPNTEIEDWKIVFIKLMDIGYLKDPSNLNDVITGISELFKHLKTETDKSENSKMLVSVAIQLLFT